MELVKFRSRNPALSEHVAHYLREVIDDCERAYEAVEKDTDARADLLTRIDNITTALYDLVMYNEDLDAAFDWRQTPFEPKIPVKSWVPVWVERYNVAFHQWERVQCDCEMCRGAEEVPA